MNPRWRTPPAGGLREAGGKMRESTDSAATGGLVQVQYEGLAPIYDYVMRHVDYGEWVGYVDDLFERFGGRPQHLVDLACGTGNATAKFYELGYRVSGIDASASMIAVAREKASRRGLDIQFTTADLRRLDGLGSFDGAVCLYDSFNYLMSLSEIDAALDVIARVLEPASLFIFDVCTENNSLRYFGDNHGSEAGEGFTYTRHSYYDRAERLQMNSFDIRFERSSKHHLETHMQRIYPHEAVVARIEASPFELVAAYDGFSYRPGSEDSDRIHFVLRSPSRPVDGGRG